MDRIKKYNTYLTTGVCFYWIIDPFNKTLEAFKNDQTSWVQLGLWVENDKARIAPFEELEIDLDALWLK
jgi:Uma2 family endonuclease